MAPSFKTTTSVNGQTYTATSGGYYIDIDATITSSSTVSSTDLSNESKTQKLLNGLLIKRKKGANFTKPKKRRKK